MFRTLSRIVNFPMLRFGALIDSTWNKPAFGQISDWKPKLGII